MAPRRLNIILAVLGLLLLAGIVLAGFLDRTGQPRVMADKELRQQGAWRFDTPRPLPAFSLLDQRGAVFDRQRLLGHWSLVFFGFTHCPDICPTTMADLARFVTQLEGLPERDDTQVVMVTVDPARDDAQQLTQYLAGFNPEFVGVTGAPAALERFSASLDTAFRVIPGEYENYQVAHSTVVVLINPRGEHHGFFKTPFVPATLKQSYRSIRAVWPH